MEYTASDYCHQALFDRTDQLTFTPTVLSDWIGLEIQTYRLASKAAFPCNDSQKGAF